MVKQQNEIESLFFCSEENVKGDWGWKLLKPVVGFLFEVSNWIEKFTIF